VAHETTTHYRLEYRGGPKPVKAEFAYLRPEAQAAYSLYLARREDRRDGGSRVRMENVRPWLEPTNTDFRAQLVRLAWERAETDPLDDLDPLNERVFGLAKALCDLHDRLAPRPPVKLVSDTSTECLHGRPYTGACADCEADE
jgi:hypothetical protein